MIYLEFTIQINILKHTGPKSWPFATLLERRLAIVVVVVVVVVVAVVVQISNNLAGKCAGTRCHYVAEKRQGKADFFEGCLNIESCFKAHVNLYSQLFDFSWGICKKIMSNFRSWVV